jgi:large subunit ribosomal protein L18e
VSSALAGDKMRRTGPTNYFLRKLIRELKKQANKENARVWLEIAYYLEKPTRQRPEVNLIKIEKVAKEGETVIIPGKLLAGGDLNKNVTVVYWRASNAAIEKLNKKGIKHYTIEEYMKVNPKGSNTRIIL